MSNPVMLSLQLIRSYRPCQLGWIAIYKAMYKSHGNDKQFTMSSTLGTVGLVNTAWSMRCTTVSDILSYQYKAFVIAELMRTPGWPFTKGADFKHNSVDEIIEYIIKYVEQPQLDILKTLLEDKLRAILDEGTWIE